MARAAPLVASKSSQALARPFVSGRAAADRSFIDLQKHRGLIICVHTVQLIPSNTPNTSLMSLMEPIL